MAEAYQGSCLCAEVSYELLVVLKAVSHVIAASAAKLTKMRLHRMAAFRAARYEFFAEPLFSNLRVLADGVPRVLRRVRFAAVLVTL